LLEQGVIECHGKRYRPTCRSLPPAREATVVLITAGDPSGQVRITTCRAAEHLMALEQECAAAAVRLAVVTYDHTRAAYGGAYPWSGELARGTASALGYVVWAVNLPPRTVRLLVRNASANGRPVAVLEESGRRDNRDAVAGLRRTRLVCMADNFAAGSDMGAYLRSLGHTRIAYVSPYHGADWSQDRLAGLRRAMRQAGSEAHIEEVIADRSGSLDELVYERFASIDRIRTRTAEAAAGAARAEHLPVAPDHAERALSDVIYAAALTAVLQSSLAALAARSEITAWVCVTDRVALAALEYLRSQPARAVPTPALAGFDDRFEAFQEGITSYNFSGRRAMAALLGHVLRPGDMDQSTTRGPLSIDGAVVERASTRRSAVSTVPQRPRQP
jgi:hypothetical protein